MRDTVKRRAPWAWMTRLELLSFAVLLLAAAVSGLWMWQSGEASHWNILTTVWGVFFLGVVLWFVLEPRSEAVQRRVWLRENKGLVREVVERMLRGAATVAVVSLGLDDDLKEKLTGGLSLSVRRSALDQVRADFDEVFNSPDLKESLPRRVGDATTASKAIRDASVLVEHVAFTNSGLLGHFHNLQAAQSEFSYFVDSPCLSPQWSAAGMPLAWVQILSATMGAMRLCGACLDALEEADSVA